MLDKDRLYRLDVLIKLYNYMQKKADGRCKVNVPWIPGQQLADNNEMQSRERLQRVGKRLAQDLKLEEEYHAVRMMVSFSGFIEHHPDLCGNCIFAA